ncbi:hypothetical protein LOZ58_003513 [Ophidiomyces ophidiicola]|nr:hypothetical protein LOZ58_003513 [Ophidiomyces ophidiicola]
MLTRRFSDGETGQESAAEDHSTAAAAAKQHHNNHDDHSNDNDNNDQDTDLDIDMIPDDPASSAPLRLPPHLIARLYPIPADRPRRRPSAASSSSRRSSISSLHSSRSGHGSAAAGGTRPRDPLVQHLRRASILESRKARLADRAAHVERVRLRAAAAAATAAAGGGPDGHRSTIKQERAAAAQLAREKLLADIAARGEEEVRRAKQKAEAMRERRAAEHARLRLEKQEKFAEVERRRRLYQQQPPGRRARRTSSAERKGGAATTTAMVGVAAAAAAPRRRSAMGQREAVGVVQRAWRHWRARRAMHAFQALDLRLARLGAMSFEAVGALLAEERVLAATGRVLRLCGLLDAAEGVPGERGAVRVFLSSFLILAHPAQVLNHGRTTSTSTSNGAGEVEQEQEHDLLSKAQDLLVAFEQAVAPLATAGLSPAARSTHDGDEDDDAGLLQPPLTQQFHTFSAAFHAWKAHDSTVLVAIMVAQFVELDLIWQTVQDDRAGGVADDYRQGIRHNQILLLARLKRLAGAEPAMDRVRQAVRQARRERRRQQGASSSSSQQQQAMPRAVTEMRTHGEDAPGTAAAAEESPTPLGEVFAAEAALAQEQQQQQQDNDKDAQSPPEQFIQLLTALPDNRTLVHELLIDRAYTIDEASYTAVRRDVMQQVCELMRRDAAAGGSNGSQAASTDWTVAMATAIRARLLQPLSPGSGLHALIRDTLDPAAVRAQCEAGAFSYRALFGFVAGVLPRLCAPVRDAAVQAFADDHDHEDAIARLARLMGVLDLLALDHTNFLLQLAAPQLLRDGPAYERRAFARDVRDGTVSLERTRRFWARSRRALVDEARRRDATTTADETPAAGKIYAHGLVGLVLGGSDGQRLSRAAVPETLDRDRARLGRLAAQGWRLAAAGAVLVGAKTGLKRDVRASWAAEAERLLRLDWATVSAARVLAVVEATRPMPAAARGLLLATIRRVQAGVLAASSETTTTTSPNAAVAVDPDRSSSPGRADADHDDDSPAQGCQITDPVARLLQARLRAHVLARLSASSAGERVRAASTASASLAAAGLPEFVGAVGALVGELERVREVDWASHAEWYGLECD